MSTTREYEAANIIPPLKNATGMRSQANIVSSSAGGVQNLASLFRGWDDGHYLTLQADGAKIYVAFGSNEVGQTLILGLTGYTIDPTVTGNGRQVCFPLPDGVMFPVVPCGGRESGSTGTMSPTLAQYSYLHHRVVSGGVATAYLRVYRSSLGINQDAGFFRPA